MDLRSRILFISPINMINILKIVFGVMFVYVSAKNLSLTDFSVFVGPEGQAEKMGIYFGFILTTLLGVWLVRSGNKKRIAQLKLPEFQFKIWFNELKSGPTKAFKNLVKNKPYKWSLIGLMGIFINFSRIGAYAYNAGGLYIDNMLLFLADGVFGGIILGCIFYWVIGAYYYVMVFLAGGKRNFKELCDTVLYTAAPFYLMGLVGYTANMLAYGSTAFDPDSMSTVLLLTENIIIKLAGVLFIYLSFSLIKDILKTKKIRSILFFIVIPALFVLFG